MPLRTKCPACGRKQSLQDTDLGQTTWCPACGNKFIAASTAPEIDTNSSAIPDIDFPINFASQLGHHFYAPPTQLTPVGSTPADAAPVQPAPIQSVSAESAPASAGPLPPAPPIPAPPVPSFIPTLHLPTQPPLYTQPQPPVSAPASNPLITLLISLVVALVVALIGGLFTILYLINRPPTSQAIAPTTPTASLNFCRLNPPHLALKNPQYLPRRSPPPLLRFPPHLWLQS